MQKLVPILIGFVLAICFITLIKSKDPVEKEQANFPAVDVDATGDEVQPDEIKSDLSWEKHQIVSGDTIGVILSKRGLPSQAIINAAKDIHDLSKIRIGKEISFLYKEGIDHPIEIQYKLSDDATLSITKEENWTAVKNEIAYEEKRSLREFKVESSFWVAAQSAGLHPRDIVGIIGVLEYDIDFNTEIRSGSEARLIVTELYKDGQFVKLAAPDALEFKNNGKKFTAIRFKNKRGKTMYYDENGLSRKGEFLRSPLPFSKVTSKFNPKRFHPILKKTRPHNGTDFGAPVGTPVRTVADGTVVSSGVRGGHGKFIKIRHDGTNYHTSYSHLSKISVSRGKRVKQGQRIGKVGKTGMATGPHLHFQMWRGNKFVDAMKEKTPKTQRLPKKEMGAFKKVRDMLLDELKAKR